MKNKFMKPHSTILKPLTGKEVTEVGDYICLPFSFGSDQKAFFCHIDYVYGNVYGKELKFLCYQHPDHPDEPLVVNGCGFTFFKLPKIH